MMNHFHVNQSNQIRSLALQKNADAAYCIETGCYGKAIKTLLEALKLTESVDNRMECSCKVCCLEACMAYSENLTKEENNNNNDNNNNDELFHSKNDVTASPTSPRKKILRRLARPQIPVLTVNNDFEDPQEGFVYKKPIQIPPQAIKEGHLYGFTLQLIITFNLALANHMKLKAEARFDDESAETAAERRKGFQKVLQLYELAYRWKTNGNVGSLRFTMVIANNLAEIHRAVGNYRKYNLCLHHLLSTMVLMLDGRQVIQNNNDEGSDNNDHNDSSSSNMNMNDDDFCTTTQMDESTEFEGFVHNTSRLILTDSCAAAA